MEDAEDRADSVWRIVRALHRIASLQQHSAVTYKLGLPALGVLNMAAVSSATPSTISQELGLPPQTVSRAIAELESAKMIKRQEDPNDGRSYVVVLTPAGRRAIEAFRRDLSDQFTSHLKNWTSQEIVEFASRLEDLLDMLAQDRHERPARPRKRNPWRS